MQQADWDMPAKVKACYPHASIVAGNRVVFNIKGNHYRLVGTHAEYDSVNVEEV